MKPPAFRISDASGGPPTQASEKNIRRVLVIIGAVGSFANMARAYAKPCGINAPPTALTVQPTSSSGQ